MNRYKQFSGPSKASATTLCQKCLKRGHYSYECTASSADRPYIARPSRTQQLMNPNLMPKLSEAQLPALEQKDGTADEILAKAAEERGWKRRRADSGSDRSDSISSVSTVSTTLSKSPSPPRPRPSVPSARDRERHSQPRKSTEHSRTQELGRNNHTKRRRRRSTSSIPSRGRSVTTGRSRPPSVNDRDGYRQERRRRSRSRSVGRKRVTRHLRSPSVQDRPPPSRNVNQEGISRADPQHERFHRRQRSSSPFSKRLALTQAMNAQ